MSEYKSVVCLCDQNQKLNIVDKAKLQYLIKLNDQYSNDKILSSLLRIKFLNIFNDSGERILNEFNSLKGGEHV